MSRKTVKTRRPQGGGSRVQPTGDGGPPGKGFLYREVSRVLRQRVSGGVYGPGVRIPTEAQLVREFGVSPITVRRAVRDLTTEGLLVGRQGLGTFVTDRRRVQRTFGAELRSSMADDMRQSGIEPGFKERSLNLVPCDHEVARRLGVHAGTPIYRHEKVLLADAEPVAIDVTFIPRRIGDVVRRDLASDFVLAVLRAHGIAMHHTDYEFEAGAISEEEGVILALPPGLPLLIVRYSVVGPKGRPVIAGRTVSRADRFTYKFCGHPEIHPQPQNFE